MRFCAALVLGGGFFTAAAAQLQLGTLDRMAQAKKQHVELLTDSVQVAAGKPQQVELQFRVLPGFHINSHAPKDELLLATTLSFEPGAVHERHEVYPDGVAFHLRIGSGETLSVYQNDFRIGVEIAAPRGASTMEGVLHYQACDEAACYPPRTLPVKIAVIGR